MLVFDLDDTLYKEADYVASGCRAIAAAAHEACTLLSPAKALSIITGEASTAAGFDALLAEIQHLCPGNQFDIKALLKIYRFHKPDISLSPEVREVLGSLKRRGVCMGIITDGRTVSQRNKIEALGLMEFFRSENIIISEEIGADKKSPEPFSDMMRRNPGESHFVYVGDNPAKDFLWPNRLGWTTVMLLDTTGRNIFPQTVPSNPETICVPCSTEQMKQSVANESGQERQEASSEPKQVKSNIPSEREQDTPKDSNLRNIPYDSGRSEQTSICASNYAPQHKIPSLRDITRFVT